MIWLVIALIAVGGAGGLVYALRRFVYDKIAEQGADAERARRAEGELQTARRQGEIMVEDRSVDDVADDLDRGAF